MSKPKLTEKQEKAIALVQGWIDEPDSDEQTETLKQFQEYLKYSPWIKTSDRLPTKEDGVGEWNEVLVKSVNGPYRIMNWAWVWKDIYSAWMPIPPRDKEDHE